MQITSAMKMVSAAKAKESTRCDYSQRPYAEKWNYYKTFLLLLMVM
jgi:F0F1-type ATP synthase gamma subunit